MTKQKIVIIGGSHAGVSAAAKVRALLPDADVTIVSDDAAFPYHRPALSKAYLSGKSNSEAIQLRPENWYADSRITLLRGRTATKILRQEKIVLLADGTRLDYDNLVLTLGAAPRLLPREAGGALANVYAVRSLADADKLKPEMTPGRRLVVIGGGYIGLEAASEASKLGVVVTVLEAADRILKRVAAAETADDIRALHRSHGVTIRESVQVIRIVETSGRASGVALAGGEIIPADVVIVGIGILPNQALAADAGLETSNGIVVDAFLRTSDPSIYAAGDCALFPRRGEKLRLESVQNANDQGAVIAANIAGQNKSYDAVPWFWSDQFDLKLQIAGLNTGYDKVLTRQSQNGPARAHFYFRGDEFLSVDCLNDAASFVACRKILEQHRILTPQQVADPGFILKSLFSQ